MDSYSLYIQGMVNQIESFLTQMEAYSTPSGIQKLETQVEQFAAEGLNEILVIAQAKIKSLLSQNLPQLEDAINASVQTASEAIAEDIMDQVTAPLGEALEEPIAEIASKALNNTAAGEGIGEALGPVIADVLATYGTQAITDMINDFASKVINEAIDTAEIDLETALNKTNSQENAAGLLDISTGSQEMSLALKAGKTSTSESAWNSLVLLLTEINNLLPQATATLKDARGYVSEAENQMQSVFSKFEEKGPEFFATVGMFWRIHWMMYFFLVVPLTLCLLFYAFWASGWCGGPQPLKEDYDTRPKTWYDTLCCLCCSFRCCAKVHDSAICFWSLVIGLQLVVLVLFIVSMIFCILSGVKLMISSGCAEIYMLGDAVNCEGSVGKIQSWLGSTFWVIDPTESLEYICLDGHLVTCQAISGDLTASALCTAGGSFLATLLSLQLIIESAMLHERAAYRRIVAGLDEANK
jgi:hypothetical protein